MSINYLAIPVFIGVICFPSFVLISIVIMDYCLSKAKAINN